MAYSYTSPLPNDGFVSCDIPSLMIPPPPGKAMRYEFVSNNKIDILIGGKAVRRNIPVTAMPRTNPVKVFTEPTRHIIWHKRDSMWICTYPQAHDARQVVEGVTRSMTYGTSELGKPERTNPYKWLRRFAMRKQSSDIVDRVYDFLFNMETNDQIAHGTVTHYDRNFCRCVYCNAANLSRDSDDMPRQPGRPTVEPLTAKQKANRRYYLKRTGQVEQ